MSLIELQRKMPHAPKCGLTWETLGLIQVTQYFSVFNLCLISYLVTSHISFFLRQKHIIKSSFVCSFSDSSQAPELSEQDRYTSLKLVAPFSH